MEEIEGRIKEIIYRNKKNRNTVFDLFAEEKRVTCIGKSPEIAVGMHVKVIGERIKNASTKKRILISKLVCD